VYFQVKELNGLGMGRYDWTKIRGGDGLLVGLATWQKIEILCLDINIQQPNGQTRHWE
jgi:hypothetical protein